VQQTQILKEILALRSIGEMPAREHNAYARFESFSNEKFESQQSATRNLNRSATTRKGEMTMKVSIITLATVLVLSSPFAMAQSGGHSHHRAYHRAASPAFRSAMNSMSSQHRYRASDTWSADHLNGHGINRLGVTTNSGRMYNGN
jgi:hypothetical protein